MIDLLGWAKNEYICVLCEYSAKGIHCKEASQSDGHGDPCYECQSAFLLMLAQWTHVQSGHGNRNGGYAWGQQNRYLLIKADMPIITAMYSCSQLLGPTLSP